MGRQIIKQPNGLYCVWSTIIDNFLWRDCTKQELIAEMIEDEIRKFKKTIVLKFEEVDSGIKKSQFTMTYEECLEIIRERENNRGE